MGIEFCKMERALEIGCILLNYTFKDGHDGKYMSCIFYHNIKKKLG